MSRCFPDPSLVSARLRLIVEGVYADVCAHAGRCVNGIVVEWNTGRVGNPGNAVESCSNRQHVSTRLSAKLARGAMTGFGQLGPFTANGLFGERSQKLTVSYATIGTLIGYRRKVVLVLGSLAARPEQQGVRGGSVKALIEC